MDSIATVEVSWVRRFDNTHRYKARHTPELQPSVFLFRDWGG